MRKIKEQKNKLNAFTVLSMILHILLFSFIILGSLNKIIKFGGSSSGQENKVINAIMIDPNIIIERYKKLQWQQINGKQANVELKKHLLQQEELRKQQKEEQKHFKIIEQQSIKIESKTEQKHKQLKEVTKKVKEQQKITENAIPKIRIEEERPIKEQIRTKRKREDEARKKIEIAKIKPQIEQKEKTINNVLTVKKTADAAKQAFMIEDLLSRLTAQQPTYQAGGAAISIQGGNRRSLVSSLDVANYKNKIQAAIQSKFYNPDIYHGKTCELKIKFDPNGVLISVAAKVSAANDQSLCDAAILAAKTAIMPKPPNHNVYDIFNKGESFLIFKP